MIPTALLFAAGIGYFLGREIEAWLVTIANRRLQRDLKRTRNVEEAESSMVAPGSPFGI